MQGRSFLPSIEELVMLSLSSRLLGGLTLTLASVGLTVLINPVHAQKTKHAVIRKALRETHRAHRQVEKLKPVYNGHRKAALGHMDLAMAEMHAALKFVKHDKEKLGTVTAYKAVKGDKHHVIRRAERELRIAHKELKSLKPIYGGHRVKAMEHLDKAVSELQQAIKFVSK
jgi:hypothetical protein